MKRAYAALFLGSVIFVTLTASAAEPACSPAREYITFMEYSRSKSEWKLPENTRRELAQSVAEHCPGSAARVIRVTTLLSESGVGSKDALTTGMRFASQSDEVTDRFVKFFKKFYLASGLDLDVATSHQLATSLSVDYGGTLPALDQEFEALVKFCTEQEQLAQAAPQCARFAVGLLTAGRDQEKGLSQRFFKLYRFLTESGTEGPALVTGAGLAIAEQVAGATDRAVESFLESYRYGVSKSGLALAVPEAVEFARDLVVRQLAVAKSKVDPAL